MVPSIPASGARCLLQEGPVWRWLPCPRRWGFRARNSRPNLLQAAWTRPEPDPKGHSGNGIHASKLLCLGCQAPPGRRPPASPHPQYRESRGAEADSPGHRLPILHLRASQTRRRGLRANGNQVQSFRDCTRKRVKSLPLGLRPRLVSSVRPHRSLWRTRWPVVPRRALLLAASRTSDITDAHVVVCARRSRQPIVTSDPADIRRLDPSAALVTL